jgi:hypothetical protein
VSVVDGTEDRAGLRGCGEDAETARKTAPRASFAEDARSNAARNASRCGAGISSTSSTTGERSSSRPEKEICVCLDTCGLQHVEPFCSFDRVREESCLP